MQIFREPPTAEAIQKQLAGLRKYQGQLEVEKEVLAADLESYDTPGYERFRDYVLAKERIRLALKRMTIAAEDQVAHERLQGQYNEVELLQRKAVDCRQDLEILRKKIKETGVKISSLGQQLQSLIERK